MDNKNAACGQNEDIREDAAGGGLLDVIEHAHIACCKGRWHKRGIW